MTDPDLVFDMDPQNVQRVERWISDCWPNASIAKQGDGSRLTWSLQGAPVDRVVATESFLCLEGGEVDRHLTGARRICDERPADSGSYQLLFATDGVRALER